MGLKRTSARLFWLSKPLLALLVATAAAGCNEGNFPVTLRNDLDEPVRLLACNGAKCDGFNTDELLAPGDTIRATAVDTARITRWWLVRREDGTTFGCIALRFDSASDDVVINVTDAVPCP